MKEIVGNKRVTNAPLPNFYHGEKQRKHSTKKKLRKPNSYFLNIDPNLTASIPESKTTFQNYIPNNGPYLSTIILTT